MKGEVSESISTHTAFNWRRLNCPPVTTNNISITLTDIVCLGLRLDKRLAKSTKYENTETNRLQTQKKELTVRTEVCVVCRKQASILQNCNMPIWT